MQMSVAVTWLLLYTITRHLEADFLSFSQTPVMYNFQISLDTYFIAVGYVKIRNKCKSLY